MLENITNSLKDTMPEENIVSLLKNIMPSYFYDPSQPGLAESKIIEKLERAQGVNIELRDKINNQIIKQINSINSLIGWIEKYKTGNIKKDTRVVLSVLKQQKATFEMIQEWI